jgi:hypothetical protein
VSRARVFLWTAAMVAAAGVLPLGATILGFDLAARIWNGLRLTSPCLSQAGDLLAGALAGAVTGLLQWSILPRVRARWIGIATLAGAAVGAARAVYPPLAIIAAPVAGALAALAQARLLPRPDMRWVRAQSLAAACVAMALLLPFPAPVSAALLLGAALLTSWGIRATYLPQPAPEKK